MRRAYAIPLRNLSRTWNHPEEDQPELGGRPAPGGWFDDAYISRRSVLGRQESVKTSLAAHFRHVKGKDGATPAYYLHLEPKNSSIGAGIWRPDSAALKRIRDAIVADPKRWQRITAGADFRSSCGMTGESLKRPPAGYASDHPLIEDLKRKDFATSSALDDRDVCGPDFMEIVLEAFRTSAPFVQFLSQAVGLL